MIDNVIEQLLVRIERLERKRHIFHAQWVSAEGTDANLSVIATGIPSEITGTDQIRFVPKLSGVSPSAGDTVVCLRDPVIIIGVLVGDITLAEDNT